MSGATLADRLAALTNRPRLVVLMSCESAGRTQADARALAAVGPRLARAGIPAVVAMQGQISMATAGRFVTAFFKALRQDGQIDRAMAVARAAVEGEPDAWMPVLFMRMNTGRLWIRAGLQGGGGSADRFDQWDELIGYINTNRCTPIIGPELNEDLFGSQHEIARRWADLYQYPLADHHRGDLSQVAQYLSDVVSVPHARNEFVRYLKRELKERYGDNVPALHTESHLADVIREVGRWKRDRDRDTRDLPADEQRPDPYQVLAELRCPLYLTANPDALLADALREHLGEKPGDKLVHERGFDRELKNKMPDPLFETEGYKPRPERPLVYHLFGRYEIDPDDDTYDLQKLVLTQDDYFQHLTAIGHNWEAVPTVVRRALSKSALVFIGFRLHDWNFRVLLQSLVWRGWTMDNTYRHVAVQIDPGEGQFQNPDMARRYLRRIIQIPKELSIYWGDTASFLRDLRARIPARRPALLASSV